MFIRIAETELNVNNAYAFRYANGKLVLKIEVPQSEIDHDDLKALLKENQGDIIKVDGDKTETFTGFSYTVVITDRDDVYECEVECVSETERKVGDLRVVIHNQAKTIADLMVENSTLTDCILDMSEIVYGGSDEDPVEIEELEDMESEEA